MSKETDTGEMSKVAETGGTQNEESEEEMEENPQPRFVDQPWGGNSG